MVDAVATSINPAAFIDTIDGRRTELFILENTNGMRVAITNYGARIVALYGTAGQKQALLADDQMLDELRPYVQYLSGVPEARGDGLAALRHIAPGKSDMVHADDAETLGMAGVLALGFGFGDHDPANRWRADVETWLLSAPAVRPIANLCTTQCASEAGACAFAFMALSGGYFEAIRFDSPLEGVIPQAAFQDSPRARLMVLRRAVLARTETNVQWLAEPEAVRPISACAAQLIADERAKYK